MKFFASHQIREIDRYTINHEPIASIDLMERAALAVKNWCIANLRTDSPILVFAGSGNNGGDGVALARQLLAHGFRVELYLLDMGQIPAPDLQTNIHRWTQAVGAEPISISNINRVPSIPAHSVAIDAIFGSGLNRPPAGIAAEVIDAINSSGALVVSIDIPSGLFGEKNIWSNGSKAVRAHHTLTLQFPKLSFFFAENSSYVGKLTILPIGLHPAAIEAFESPYEFVQQGSSILSLPAREKFAHKGTYGHCLLIAGMYGMCGAAILAARAALRSGAGLVSVHTPSRCYPMVQQSVPEAIFSVDENELHFSRWNGNTNYTAIGIGPGIGTHPHTLRGLTELLQHTESPMVIDADALNIIANSLELLNSIPARTIITPHPKEFERLFGPTASGYDQLQLALEKARQFNIFIILKGAYSKVVSPCGRVFVNSTGNPGMATAGSGDVLSGILLSLLCQGMNPMKAAALGTFVHGLAGDLAVEQSGQMALTASDIIEHIGCAFMQLEMQDDSEINF